MNRTTKTLALAATSLAVVASGCGSNRSTTAQIPTAIAASYTRGGPGFQFDFSGAVNGHGTPGDAGKLPSGAPAGTTGSGAGLAFCGLQPATARRFGGAYALATQVNIPQYLVVRVVVPNYSTPGTFPAKSSTTAKPPGTAVEIDEHTTLAQSGQITITGPKSGSITADFLTTKGPVHVHGRWRCP